MFEDVYCVDFVENFVKKYTAEKVDWLQLVSNIPYLGTKAIIAGGFPRRIIGNEPIAGSDIDIYFSRTHRAATYAGIISALGQAYEDSLITLGWNYSEDEHCYVNLDKDFNLSYDVKSSRYGKTYTSFVLGRDIQVVDKNYCGTVKEIFNGFDIRACKVATDFVSLYYDSPEVLSDIEQKHIIPVMSWRPVRVYRIKKFLNMGWTGPTPSYHNTLVRICETYSDTTIIPYEYDDNVLPQGSTYTEELLNRMFKYKPIRTLEDVVIFEGTNT